MYQISVMLCVIGESNKSNATKADISDNPPLMQLWTINTCLLCVYLMLDAHHKGHVLSNNDSYGQSNNMLFIPIVHEQNT